MSHISNANIRFNEHGMPYATDFDDIYFSDSGGMAETDYVFLQQNQLPQRWLAHRAAHFHIIETGFGTGANFLLSWLRFKQFRKLHPDAHCQRLYFSSIEKFPLKIADLQQALALHADLQPLCQQLLAVYPHPIAGCHRLYLDNGSVIVDLWFGDASEMLANITAPADAIYLDGFAPSKNPDMWQPALFKQLARLSHATTTVSTFTAAGLVKRGLTEAGFNVEKIAGFGRKRHMLVARYNTEAAAANTSTGNTVNQATEVTIVGGGIASLCTALALMQRHIPVRLLCADTDVATQASQNRQGAVYPNLHAQYTAASRLHVQAFGFARQFYNYWATQGMQYAMDWCGVLHLASNEQLALRQQKLIQSQLWPEALLHAVTAQQASQLAGLALQQEGVFLPEAGWLSPKQFCREALNYLQQQPGFSFHSQCELQQFQQQKEGWQLITNQGSFFARQLILACGKDLASFSQTRFLPLHKVRGQVSHVKQPEMAPLKTVLCHKGYITPQWQHLHCVGATFDRQAEVAAVLPQDNAENLQLVNQQLQQPNWFNGAEVDSAAAAFRATLPDRLPVAGSCADGLYLLGGMGARGILLSPLLAEIIAAQLCKEPVPADNELIAKLGARRFEAS